MKFTLSHTQVLAGMVKKRKPHGFGNFCSRGCLLIMLMMLSQQAFTQPDTSFHIYLMFGQSNMEGAGKIESQDLVTHPRVKMMQDLTCSNLNRNYGEWYTASPPLNRCWSGLGPGDSFGRMLGAEAPPYVTIGLINASVSGCNIYIYKKGCPDGLDAASQGIPFDCGYAWLLDLAKKAQQVGVIKGIIFHQGETNTGDPNWKYTVQQIVKDLKADLGLGDIPFLAGELLYAQYNSCCSAHNVEINKLPDLIPNAFVISAAGLPGADYAHFTSASYRTLGERYARKMLQLVYHICDSSGIEPWYSLNDGTLKEGDSILVNRGTKIILSPAPSNALGTWSWNGAGISGTARQLVMTPATEGIYNAMVTYTNECGAISRLSYKIVVCDSVPLEPWYSIDGGAWKESASVCVRKGASLALGPHPVDAQGTWFWSIASPDAASREQVWSTAVLGTRSAIVAFTNGCGAISHLQMKITVSDSTFIQSCYTVNDGSLSLSGQIRVNKGDSLVLQPFPFNATGTWTWSGAGLYGNVKQQQVNTNVPGTYDIQLMYTNSCGIDSHLPIQIVVDAITGIITNAREGKQIEVFPNPASQVLYIRDHSFSGKAIPVTCLILNSLGQVLQSATFSMPAAEYMLDISRLGAGTYYCKLVRSDGPFMVKFVKMK